MRHVAIALLCVAAVARLPAQAEDRLRSAFEGSTVRLRIDMPGTAEGVDVVPGTAHPVDFPKHATRLKKFGTAMPTGSDVLVTKVKVKNDLVEFQLGGGGYGTFGDDNNTSVSATVTPKSEREKNLERDLKSAADSGQRRRLREELDNVRRQRDREDSRNQAMADQAAQSKEATIRQRRRDGGSRFNIRFGSEVLAAGVTPEMVMQALADYVDFGARGAPVTVLPGAIRSDLRKGLSVAGVDSLLGRPESITQRMEGTLSVSTSSYRSREQRITAEFVEGVLVRYTISSP